MALDDFRKVNIILNKANQRILETQIAKVGDANGRELVVQITNNGVIEDQTGTTLKLNWQHENGNQDSTNFNVVDIKMGVFSVFYPKEMLYKGKVDASIEIASNGQITNSMNFEIDVQADVFDGEAGTVNGVFISLADVNKKLDDREAEYEELKTRQSSVETQFNSIQQELTGKDVVSAPEIIAARNGEENLKARLDKEYQEVSTQLAQTDFVAQVSRLIGGYEKMYYKRENSIGWVSVMLLNKDEHITWTFRNNEYDDFYILGDCFAGGVTRDLAIYQNKNYDTTTGTWVTSAQNTHYTTEVGATMTTYFDGEKIEFHHYADNRGGIWEFVLDDDTENKVSVSTWSETAIATNNKVLFEGLKFGTHKLVGTFKGDDPSHVPSSGAGTSRGWVYVNGLNGYLTYRSFKTQLINSRVQDIMVGFSNKEFAFSLRKSGTTQSYQFVPMHNSIGTAFEKEPVKFIADSQILSEADISNLTVGEFYECTKFSAIQSVYGRNPASNSENLVEINANVTISKDGNVEITGKLKPLTNVDIENGYAIMFPMNKSATTKVITSKNNEYPTVLTDGSRTNLNAEGDTTKSLIFVSSENDDYVSSLRFNDMKNTLRIGEEKGDVDMWIEHRDANMQKLYFRQFSNAIMTPAETFKFSATFNCAKVIDVYNLI